MLKRILISGLAISFFVTQSFATPVDPAVEPIATAEEPEVFTIAADDPIAARLDSLALLTIFRNIEKRSVTDGVTSAFPAGFIPEYSDSVYIARFQHLNAYSPMEVIYNPHVKGYINLYANRRRDLTERVLGLAQLYFPLFEEQLDKYDLPLELKYLAVIESALNPLARSRVGATGLWQFMYGTGKMYGLQVNSMIDDRSDIYRSTVAACEHFVDLYKIYNDWNLVLCAYNAGPGNVNRAIRRAGGVKDFWKIRPYLPRETQNYVPAFMAVTYVMEHAKDHNLYPNPPIFSHLDVDTLKVRGQLNLRTVSEFLDIPIAHLRFLNPTFRQDIIPHNANRPYVLRIPRDFTGLFLANEDTIYNHRSPEQIRQEQMAAQIQETTIHVVRQGEVLGGIARRYGTSVSEIQRLNNIRGTTIRVGQRLVVSAPARTTVNVAANTNTHVVRSGETLGVISARYGVSVAELQTWNNLNGSVIHPGQNLVVRRPANQPQVLASVQNIEPETEEADEDQMIEREEMEYILYTVQQGDTLQKIVSKFEHITLEEMKELNDITSGDALSPGQILRISAENLDEESK